MASNRFFSSLRLRDPSKDSMFDAMLLNAWTHCAVSGGPSTVTRTPYSPWPKRRALAARARSGCTPLCSTMSVTAIDNPVPRTRMPSSSQKPRHSLLIDTAGLSRRVTLPYFSPPTTTGRASSRTGRSSHLTNQSGASTLMSGPMAATGCPALSIQANLATTGWRARAFTICSITEYSPTTAGPLIAGRANSISSRRCSVSLAC